MDVVLEAKSEKQASSTCFAGVDFSKYSLSAPLQAHLMLLIAVTSLVSYSSKNIIPDAN